MAGGVATLKARYIRGNGLVARKDERGKAYYLHNGHGDVVGLMDASGKLRLNSYSYDIWGNIASQREAVPQPFKYSGELWDSTTSLQYLRARWYDPSMGRFVNEDTYQGQINNPLSLNLYTYVENSPLRYFDPTGHEKVEPGYYLNFYQTQMTYCQQTNADCSGLQRNIDLEIAYANGEKGDIVTGMSSTQYYNEFMPTDQEKETLALQLSTTLPFPNVKQGAKSAVATEASGCNCFTAGTKILTDEGEKNIEDIEVGDKVLSKNENNPDGELAYKEVTQLFRNQRDDIIKLHVWEQIIETTNNHPFWVEGKGWVFADELQAGDKLQKADGRNLTIDRVEFVKLDEPVTVYNFAVAQYHTYYVTDLGIWVHNTGTDGSCNFTFPKSNKDMKTVFGIDDKTFHKEVKPEVLKQIKSDPVYGKEFKKMGNNPDIGVDESGNIVLKDVKTGKTLPTDWSFESFLP